MKRDRNTRIPSYRGLRLLLLSIAMLGLNTPAFAHGIWGHIHVTGWAIENLPAGELRDFFDDPEVMNAALFGAAFTDSGYWPQIGEHVDSGRAYSEHTHWEPFIADFVAWIDEYDPPPWDNLESRKRVAFLMGCAAHGLQDEVFDSLFLPQVGIHDGRDQADADPASDAFLAADKHLRFVPTRYIPMDTLLTLYADLDHPVTAENIEAAVYVMEALYVNEEVGPDLALGLFEQYEELLPWTYNHLLDLSIPGSLRAEIIPTLRYLEALWERLHGRYDADDPVISTHPNPPHRLKGGHTALAETWVTFIYGIGVRADSVTFRWEEDDGEAIPFQTLGTRWGATWTRLHRLLPETVLDPGAWYQAQLSANAELVDGRKSSKEHSVRFQVDCKSEDDPECPEIDPSFVPTIDGSAPVYPDAGNGDNDDVQDNSSDAGPQAPEEESPPLPPADGCQTTGETFASPWLALLILLLALHPQRPKRRRRLKASR